MARASWLQPCCKKGHEIVTCQTPDVHHCKQFRDDGTKFHVSSASCEWSLVLGREHELAVFVTSHFRGHFRINDTLEAARLVTGRCSGKASAI